MLLGGRRRTTYWQPIYGVYITKRYPVLSFYILAFALSWLGLVPAVAGSYGIAPFDQPAFGLYFGLFFTTGPAIAAVVVAGVTSGKKGVRNLFTPLLVWRVNFVWYLMALLGPILLFAGATLVDSVRTGAFIGLKAISPWYGMLLFLVPQLFVNVWEEIGWRGFALPRLQSRYHALTAALVVGVLWGLWHLPLFWIVGNPQSREPFITFLIGIVAQSILYTWLYNSSKGSLLIVSLFHAAINIVGGSAYAGSQLGMTVVSCLAAIILVFVVESSRLSSQTYISANGSKHDPA